MWWELLFLTALVFLIGVLFYRRRAPDLTILQMEMDQAEQLPALLAERQPLVIRGVSPPKGLTLEGLQKIPRLGNFAVGGQPLSAVLETPKILASAGGLPALNLEYRQLLATELAVPVWAEHTWLPLLSSTTWLGGVLGCMRSEIVLGGQGMARSTALYTLILPTAGKYNLSLLSKDSEAYLPPNWEYRYPSSLGPNDTPLVSELKFMDIVVRPGTTVCLPPHMIYSIEPTTDSSAFAAAAVLEYHEPMSLISKSFQTS
jgi:hypothetical protein